MKDMLFAGGGLLSVIAAAFSMWRYLSQRGENSLWFILFALFGIVALVSGVLFLSGRVNKKEEIHITE